jgi:two-component system NtrC family sensor kinase
LNEVVEKALDLVKHDLRIKKIAVEKSLAEDLPTVAADEDQLNQVIINLLTNARDAMGEDGRVIIRTGLVKSDGARALELRVEDTGPGIDTENMADLFEPFYTTKPEGEGTGLGLAICHGIIEAHGGSIWAENAPEGGAVFLIRLNAEEDMANKILIVDDEAFVRKALQKILKGKGFSVTEASSGDEALASYQEERPDVVILDVRMPGKDGIETLKELKAQDPEASVIMLTALHDEELARQALDEGAFEYITKSTDLDYLEMALMTKIALATGGDE